jgi:selenide, water dikinase
MSRLVLLGGGHSHVEVLRQLALRPMTDTSVHIVSDERYALYSGMLPGWVAGHYAFDACCIDLPALCRAAGARFSEARAHHIDAALQRVRLNDGSEIDYDFLSINIGAVPDTESIPGAALHGIAVKPLTAFVSAWKAMQDAARRADKPLTIAVVGAGAGGVELALAMNRKLSTMRQNHSRDPLHLFTDKTSILSEHGLRVQRKFERILGDQGIVLHRESPVTALAEGKLQYGREGILAFDYAVIATPVRGMAWLARSGLRVEQRGFIVTNAALQSSSHPTVFAAGDAAAMEGCSVPKSGVYAVRQGPILAENLRRVLAGRTLLPYRPQRSALALISTGERYAVASWNGVAVEGNWVWRWKDAIDRGFIAKYRVRAV